MHGICFICRRIIQYQYYNIIRRIARCRVYKIACRQCKKHIVGPSKRALELSRRPQCAGAALENRREFEKHTGGRAKKYVRQFEG